MKKFSTKNLDFEGDFEVRENFPTGPNASIGGFMLEESFVDDFNNG